MSDRNTTISSLGSRTLNLDTIKPHLQLSALRSDLVEKLQEQQRAQRNLIRVSTPRFDLARQMQEQQRAQRELIRATIHPPFLTIGKQQRKSAGNSVKEAKLLRQENSELRRQLRRHQRLMLPSNQPGDGEVWMSLR